MIGGGDWGVFFNPAVFGDELIYHPAGRAPFSACGLFTAAHAEISRGGFGPGVSGMAPVLTVPPDFVFGVTPQPGDGVSVRGEKWRVADIQRDGSGMARLILERW